MAERLATTIKRLITEQEAPEVVFRSFTKEGGRLTVNIGDKSYTYLDTNPRVSDTVQYYISKGWHGKAIQLLRKYKHESRTTG